MDMAEHEWRSKYKAALIEMDDNRLPKNIYEARQAIMDRVPEVPENSSERQELDSALKVLGVLFELFLRRDVSSGEQG